MPNFNKLRFIVFEIYDNSRLFWLTLGILEDFKNAYKFVFVFQNLWDFQ